MLRLDSADRADMVTDAALELMAEGGSTAVTLRSLAERIGASSPGVLSWFGSTDRMWQVIAVRCGQRWMGLLGDWGRRESLTRARLSNDLHLLLPVSDDEVIWTRAWLGLVEVGRHRHGVGALMAMFEADERAWVGRQLRAVDAACGPDSIDAVVALVRGLRHAICAPTHPMPVRRAHEVLAKWLRHHRRRTVGER